MQRGKIRKTCLGFIVALTMMGAVVSHASAQTLQEPIAQESANADEQAEVFFSAQGELNALLDKYSSRDTSDIVSASGSIPRIQSAWQYPAALSDVLIYYGNGTIDVRLYEGYMGSTVADKAMVSELEALQKRYIGTLQISKGNVSINDRNTWMDIVSSVNGKQKYWVQGYYWNAEEEKLYILMPGASRQVEDSFRAEVLDNAFLVFNRDAVAADSTVGDSGLSSRGISWFDSQMGEAIGENQLAEAPMLGAQEDQPDDQAVEIQAIVLNIPVYAKEKTVEFRWKEMKSATSYRYKITNLDTKTVESNTKQKSKEKCIGTFDAKKSKKDATYRLDVIGYDKNQKQIGAYTAFFRCGKKNSNLVGKPYAPNASKSSSVVFSKRNRVSKVRYSVVTTN